ncbi:hypothetical protein [uncultured Fluviicola sp.]|uniref:hypothetical protein n=1 Tax=uncultured Fluviicola sp. TaxID=463303 RepID=UPI0025D11931|nr:hypothetical protein [uncultured Fluviicola sp.]
MTKLFLTYILTSLAITCFGQQTEIINEKTNQHIRIPGTRVFLIPPKGFTIAKGFLGLRKGDDAYIQIFDLVGGSFYSNARSINRENFEAAGMKVYDYSEFQFDNYPAKYIYLRGTNLLNSYQLTFGDSTFSAMMLSAFYPDDKEMEKQVKECILSAYYDTSVKIDPFETAYFSIDESSTKYKFQEYAANIYAYSVDGVKSEDTFSPTVMITQLPAEANSTYETLIESMINGLKQNSFIQTGIVSSTEKTINGFKGYEKIVKGYFKRKKVTVYYLAFIKDDISIVFCGITHAEDDSDLKDFVTFSSTMKLK